MKLKHFDEAERKAFKEEHELGQPMEWAVMDGALVYGFFETEAQAKAGLIQANKEEAVYDDFQEWLNEKALQYGVTTYEIERMIR